MCVGVGLGPGPGTLDTEDQAVLAVLRGFAVAIQDTRVRHQSEGHFRFMQDDGPDGWTLG
jgi:predicted acyl esterase